jgi:DNA mismatch repair protein MutS2
VAVRSGAVRTRVALEDLRLLEPKPGTKDGGRAANAPAPARQTEDLVRTSDNTLDLRGMTVDEALAATDAYLDRALGGGVDAVFILHGHGTGALRDAVRRYLEDSPYAARFRPGTRAEGGDGITAVWLE